jgi:flagellar biosynthesis protein FlhF
MKMKRYVAPDMRSALRAIREEQGPDAVILSSRPVRGGVEVCAAVDIELAAGHTSTVETAAMKQLERATIHELQREATQAVADAWRPQAPGSIAGRDEPDDDIVQLGNHLRSGASADASASADGQSSVGEELRSLRGLLEQQLAALAWNNFTRREPLKARALTDLANLGLDRALALQIVDEMPATLNADQAQRLHYALLSRRLKVCEPPVRRSGALLLVGPSGSGKTTTLSKLATRYVMEHDGANLVIISADDERLGSHEQLRSLGRLLGVRVENVSTLEEVATRVAALPDRMILIDTPGVSCRDAATAARYRQVRRQQPTLQVLLALPASAQSGVLDDVVEHFGTELATACALTRVDEAVSLGGVLSALARSQLPIAYCCEGTRIPEDIRPTRAHQLIARAMDLARQSNVSADDDLLARRYGRNVNAAA